MVTDIGEGGEQAERIGRPMLGLATTEELLTEVAVRMEATQNSLKGSDLGRLCREAIANLSAGVLGYRLVGRRPAQPRMLLSSALFALGGVDKDTAHRNADIILDLLADQGLGIVGLDDEEFGSAVAFVEMAGDSLDEDDDMALYGPCPTCGTARTVATDDGNENLGLICSACSAMGARSRIRAAVDAPWCECWMAVRRHKHVEGEGIFTESFVLGAEWAMGLFDADRTKREGDPRAVASNVSHFGRNETP